MKFVPLNIQVCPVSCPIKNSVFIGPSRRERPGTRKGDNVSKRSMVKGSALLLSRRDPEREGPSHALCFPNETCTLPISNATWLSSSSTRLTVAVALGNNGLSSACATASSAPEGYKGVDEAC